MNFANKVRATVLFKKTERFYPALAFLGGFSWDSITIGNMVYGTDLVFLSIYYLFALGAIYFISTKKRIELNDSGALSENHQKCSFYEHFLDREWPSAWMDRLTWIIQFCFGNLYSALVISYFRSSGSLASFVIVLILAVFLVANEFLKRKYENFAISLAFFCLLGTMFINFLIPHLVHRMGTFWFFLSTFLSAAICYMLWTFSSRKRNFLVAPAIITVSLCIAYLANWIPPVPLVLKQQVVCKNFDPRSYSCDTDKPDFWQRTGFKSKTIHRKDGDEVYFMSSVYGPAELKAPIEFRWFYKGPNSSRFILTDKISSHRMVIKGGREKGYRSYSKKKNIPTGTYRVETAYKNGSIIGAETFKVLDGVPKHGFVRDSLK